MNRPRGGTEAGGRSLWDSVGAALLQDMPCAVTIMDREFRILEHNRAFVEIWGEGRGKPCWEVYRRRRQPCTACAARETFQDGRRRVLEESGRDLLGQSIHYLAQINPLRGESGEIEYLATITTDLTTTRRLQREYQTLFEKVPCYVAVLNRDRRVVKANELFRRTFGEPLGEPCYRLFKHRQTECDDCPAARTFADGTSHTSRHLGCAQDGHPTHYVVSTAPLVRGDGEVTHVIEMCLDVTATHHLEAELRQATVLSTSLVENSIDAIVVTDSEQRVVLMNPAAEHLWGVPRSRALGRRVPARMIPGPLRRRRKAERRGAAPESSPPAADPGATEASAAPTSETVVLGEHTIDRVDGERIPVRLVGMAFHLGQSFLGGAVIAQDLRELKELEQQKLTAERLAAVGQTVAGLAHGIKNVLMGIEGGMYAFRSGMSRGDDERMLQGWHMLEDNIERITSFVKEFLEFARGREPSVQLADPNEIAGKVVALFRDKAELAGIALRSELQAGIAYALMDAEAIHTCLTNLVSNALDACEISDRSDRAVTVRTREAEGVLVMEVADNGVGIDYEIKKKVFTNFFSTKAAGKGTGLGLLTTSKIVQEHGGKVSFESTEGEGSVFRLEFPRDRLPRRTEAERAGAKGGGS